MSAVHAANIVWVGDTDDNDNDGVIDDIEWVHGYENLIKLYLLRPWGGKCLCDITKQHVKRLLLAKQESGLNINNLRICISALFQEAVEREILPVNVAHNLGKVFRNNHVPKTQSQALTKTERDTFLALAEKEKSRYCMFYMVLFKTGMRLGEALALATEDINWNSRQVTVRRNLSHNYWTTPKSGRDRKVDLIPHLVEALKEYCMAERKVCKSSPDKIKLVFSNKNGEPFNPDAARLEFHELLQKAGIKKCRLQDCRHSFASILLSQGASIFYVMKQLGHADVKLTCNLYGHLLPESRDTASLTD